MPTETLFLQLSWEDPETGQTQQALLAPPVAIGRDAEQMPEDLDGQAVSRLELVHRQISRFHALITVANYQLYITDRSANGTFLNGQPISQTRQLFSSGDTVRIGPYKITASLVHDSDTSATELTNLTEHNRSVDRFSRSRPSSNQNMIVVWLIGICILLLMGIGAWVLISNLLEQARPRVPETPTSMQVEMDS